MNHLALFDLDHTLIPFDSGMAWTRFLAGRGVLPPDAEATYLRHCQDYVAGTLDIRAMHRASVAPLARFEPKRIAQWGVEFEAEMAPRVPPAMRALVEWHRHAGDLCAIVTATTRFVAAPFARLFGVDHLLATEPAVGDDGRYDGEIAGEPCYREHKIGHVERWLGSLPEGGADRSRLASFGRSWFYSDSFADLPLLEAVTDPVAVRPDERLRGHAARRGWPVIDA